MAERRPIRKLKQDLRELPTYTIPEAALFLGVPQRTLREWFSTAGDFLSPSGSAGNLSLLSFTDVVEAYAIFLMRSHYKLSMQSIRRALKELPRHTTSNSPLVSENLKVFEDYLLLDRPARGRHARHVVNLSKDGQYVIASVVDIFASRVLRNSSGDAISIFPWRHWDVDENCRPVQIDPSVMSGRLVVTGTRIPVLTIHDRFRRGQTANFIAEDFGLPLESVQKAIQHIDKKAA